MGWRGVTPGAVTPNDDNALHHDNDMTLAKPTNACQASTCHIDRASRTVYENLTPRRNDAGHSSCIWAAGIGARRFAELMTASNQ
jgi:hypothetical protein